MQSIEAVISEKLRELRIKRDLKQSDVAEAMNEMGFEKWSQTTVWSIEKGGRPMRLSESHALSQFFSVPIDYFLGELGVAPEPVENEGLRLAIRLLRAELTRTEG